MSDIKLVIAKNIYDLRISNSMTQLELAEKLHYSDKSVSKWEKGDSLPEIATLLEIAQMFNVTLDYLVQDHSDEKKTVDNSANKKVKVKNQALISGMGILLVWLVATFVFFMIDIFTETLKYSFLPFLFAIPITLIVWLVFNSIWFNHKRNFFIISLLMWSSLATLFVVFFIFGINIPKIFFLGIPGQIIIGLWSRIKVSKKNK